ncbi:phenylacetic acid degradation protein PaaN [Aromatoleum aromaticum]|uniref:phenylacetic acid degradation protein PaaN n=1 Tax=Aromatoleum aromaticum TaxID=551760 RepID=UPI001459A0C5|nr:phenylacetic acid degradation protein PaaN [Aromatoleum aromaticum]NMG55901.1 phenylacetic acid degradation protein PaaN [Aromatoleum aromaticum]
MTHPMFARHQAMLDRAVQAVTDRGYWSPFSENPSPKVYGETAMADGRAAFDAYCGTEFQLDQPGCTGTAGSERSPYGVPINIRYPRCSGEALIEASKAARGSLQALGPQGRVGALLEALVRLNQRSFEIAHAVMFTTGQGWMMAFQAGAAHAQDRALEAVAYAWREMSGIPAEAHWEKPQGKNPALVLKKRYEIVGRGTALVIGCGTFPTWNTYLGLFAALATGNPVIVKPHRNAILPAAITVRVLREVLAEAGADPNAVLLAVDDSRELTRFLATHKAVKSIDFTGSNSFGNWLIENCRQAQVYAELAGVNNVVIESTDDYKGMLRNLAFTLSLYSGQMCTTTQAILVPAGGIDTDQGHKSYDEVAADLGRSIDKLLADPAVASAVLGCIQSSDTLGRLDEASRWGDVVLASQPVAHPEYPEATVRTPVLLKCDAADEAAYMEERFGPIAFVVRTPDAAAAIALSERITTEHGALTVGAYTAKPDFAQQVITATQRAGVALSLNLTGGVYVNQSAAYSDYHGTGANPSANASYADSAFVANRFRVIQHRFAV